MDDKPEKLLALGAVLEDLGQRIVCAGSGREALRHLLNGEFAVILLDVNMPDMDGFEAAALIRQRASLQHVPIIFITAFGDETHMARGYSLGAVDYIHAPVIPEVLRSKVSVFVELYQKTAQVRRQSESLHRRATQFEKLGRASMAINGAIAIEQMLQRVTDGAREIIDSHQCLAVFISEAAPVNRRGAIRSAASFSDQHAKWRERDINLDALASTVIAQISSAVRLGAGELREHADWPAIRQLGIPPVHGGLLAVPLDRPWREEFGRAYFCSIATWRDSRARINPFWCNWLRSLRLRFKMPFSRQEREAQPVEGRISGDLVARAANAAECHRRLDRAIANGRIAGPGAAWSGGY